MRQLVSCRGGSIIEMAMDNLNQSGASLVTDQGAGPTDSTGGSSDAQSEATEQAPAQDFSKILESYEREAAIEEGQVVVGTILDVSDQNIIVDIGYKCEGVVPRQELLDYKGNLSVKPGDRIEVLIRSLEERDGYALLSRAEAQKIKSWDQIRRSYQNQETITGYVKERIKGGLKVDLGGVEAFLPGSQIDLRPVHNPETYVGQTIEVRVIKLNRRRNNVVVSRKAVLEEITNKKKAQILSQIEEGVIMEGTIKSLTDYGAFIDLGGVDGLLHITDMSWGRIKSPSELFKVGDQVQVKVLKFDREKERISLGYKQLLPDPWDTVAERYPKGSRARGRVVSTTDYGAFIELEPGIEGLVHVTEMVWSRRLRHPSKIVSVGQEVEVVVLDIDTKNRRISLGMKQTTPDPWETIAERYHVGSRVTGKVRSLTTFGAFVEIEDGIDGLVHISDISWTKRIKHPADVLRKGQQVEAIITNIDTERRRLSLSMKDLEPNAWGRFFSSHRVGDVVKGKVARFASFGAFIELEDGIEGLCHISELSDERVEKPEDAVKIGQVLQFRILKLDPEQKKIGLSARAVGRENDPEDVRNYQDTSIATLGDVAKLLKPEEKKED
jgi:small subunit ribosomal protein S1